MLRHQWPPPLSERLAQVRIAGREQRPLPELGEEHPDPQPADRQRRGEVEPVDEEVAHVLALRAGAGSRRSTRTPATPS